MFFLIHVHVYQYLCIIAEFCSEFQQGSTGNMDTSELQRRTSTKDSMVQTDPLDTLNVQSSMHYENFPMQYTAIFAPSKL